LEQQKNLFKLAGITFSISIFTSLVIRFVLIALKPTLQVNFEDYNVLMIIQMIFHILSILLPTLLAIAIIKPSRATLGIKFCGFRNLFLAIPIGLFAIPVVACANGLFLILIKSIFGKISYTGMPTPENIEQLLIGILCVAVYPALSEELAFRGLMLAGLRQRFSLRPAILLCGTFFAMNHFSIQVVAGILLIGVLYSYVTWKTGSILPAIIMHFINNAVSELLSYFSSSTAPQSKNAAIQTISQIFDFANQNWFVFLIQLITILLILAFSIFVCLLCIHFLKKTRLAPEAAPETAPETAPENAPVEVPVENAKRLPGMGWFIPGIVFILIIYVFEILSLMN